MTCVCAIRDSGRVYMGSDSCIAEQGTGLVNVDEHKLCPAGHFLIGCAGNSRLPNLLFENAVLSKIVPTGEPHRVIEDQFIPAS